MADSDRSAVRARTPLGDATAALEVSIAFAVLVVAGCAGRWLGWAGPPRWA
ncbi:MAG: hypothetical protein JWM53_1728, partial [bacterium]|nr:hypothetical protein [bacterium]